MFVNPQVGFVMFLLCYARCWGYLLHIVFPSPSILHHYAEFNTRTIVTLEKLLGAGSFSDSIGHLVRCQVILLVFSGGFSFPSMVQTIALTFLGCWALIILALVSHF
jgi:hypothetical protein